MASRVFNLRQGARPVADSPLCSTLLRVGRIWRHSIEDELATRELGEDLESLIMLAIRMDNHIRERVRQRPFDTTPAFRFPDHPKPTEPSMEDPI